MKLALAQMSSLNNMEANLNKSLKYIKEAAENQADIVLFPEVQLTNFFPQYPDVNAEEYKVSIDSHIIRQFCQCCKEHHIMAVPNVYLLEDGKTYDASILINSKGEITGIQKMVHVAQAPQFYEQSYYTPSNEGFKVFNTEYGNIGIVVCFDRHYPESVRTEALMGADVILIPTVNTKEEPSEMFEWELRVQAFQNSVAIAMCNRIGQEGNMNFSGESLAVDANGGILAKADDTEQLMYIEIDVKEISHIRAGKNYTQLRRKELYK